MKIAQNDFSNWVVFKMHNLNIHIHYTRRYSYMLLCSESFDLWVNLIYTCESYEKKKAFFCIMP